jgi:hypothetical protein
MVSPVNETVMDAVEIGRIEEEESGGATVPAVLQYRAGTVHGRRQRAGG